MTGHRKKIVASLLAIALVCGALIALSNRFSEKAKPENPKSDTGFLFANNSNFSTNTNKNISNQELFFKMMLSVLLVAALGAAAFYVSKKLLPRIANTPGKQIRILETTYLGPKKAVHLIEITNQQNHQIDSVKRLLIGSTNESVTFLADLTGALTENSAQEEFSQNRVLNK